MRVSAPTGFPVIQVFLCLLETLEAETFQRCLFSRAPTPLSDLSLPVRDAGPLHGSGYRAVNGPKAWSRYSGLSVGSNMSGGENAFAQIIEDNHSTDATEPAKSLLMQLSPSL